MRGKTKSEGRKVGRSDATPIKKISSGNGNTYSENKVEIF